MILLSARQTAHKTLVGCDVGGRSGVRVDKTGILKPRLEAALFSRYFGASFPDANTASLDKMWSLRAYLAFFSTNPSQSNLICSQPLHSQSQSQTEGQGRRGSSGSKPRKNSAINFQEVPDHGPNARRDSLRLPSTITSPSACIGQQQEERCALTIQRNVRGTGRRKKFLTLQSAREDFEHHVQTLVSAAATGAANGGAEQGGAVRVGSGGSWKGVYAAAVRLLETGREDGLAKPPFELLRDMYSSIEDVAGALASLSVGEEAGTGMGAAGDGIREGSLPRAAGMMEACGAAKEALDAIRQAVGADIAGFGDRATLSGPSAAPMAPRQDQSQPVGSGRAAAVAMASGRGGLLVSPEDSPATCGLPVTGQLFGENNEARREGGWTDSGEERYLRPVPLRTLDVKSVAQLLRMNGFEEHAPGFVIQGVDGVMLSDPNLCEADFAELGLGGGGGGGDGGGRGNRARIVSFFHRCQQEGAVFPASAGSPQSITGVIGQRSEDRSAGDPNLDERRRDHQPSTEQSNLRSSEGSSWRRGSALVDRENQRVLAQITIDPSETGGSGAASSGENGHGRRISVKLNNGVVVTTGGREEGLIDNTDELMAVDAETEAAAAAVTEEGANGAFTAVTSGGGASPSNSQGRRTSIGLPTMTLYKEPSRIDEGSNLHTAEVLPLPPGLAVTAPDSTVNVFR